MSDALFPPVPSIPVADTIRAGIEQQPLPCWTVVHPDGTPHLDGDDNSPHYDSMRRAVAAYAGVETNDGGILELRPTLCDEPCWAATAACGYRYDEEGDGIVDFATRAEAAEAVVGARWRIRDGVLLCPDHHECEECDEAVQAGIEVLDSEATS